jgi:hypothetical protein
VSAGEQAALEVVRVTAARVHRFADAVERDPFDEESRKLWRAALADFRRSVRQARAQGLDVSPIQEAAGHQLPGRFRPPEGHRDDAQSAGSSSAAA